MSLAWAIKAHFGLYIYYTYIYNIISHITQTVTHYMGSKAEGLDLPGSDDDYMYDINDKAKVTVIQSTHDPHDASSQNTLYLCTNDVPPCFAMLSHDNKCRNMQLLGASMNMNGVSYLSSSKLVHDIKSTSDDSGFSHSIHGPSVEDWNEYLDKSESGRDNVFSIHCRFWPQVAKEWLVRPRHFGWPSSRDLERIIYFGCHFIPVVHPLSPLKLVRTPLNNLLRGF